LRRGPGGVDPAQSICIDDYIGLLKRAGWEITHIIDAPPVHPAISAKDGQPDAEKTGPSGWFAVH